MVQAFSLMKSDYKYLYLIGAALPSDSLEVVLDLLDFFLAANNSSKSKRPCSPSNVLGRNKIINAR